MNNFSVSSACPAVALAKVDASNEVGGEHSIDCFCCVFVRREMFFEFYFIGAVQALKINRSLVSLTQGARDAKKPFYIYRETANVNTSSCLRQEGNMEIEYVASKIVHHAIGMLHL